MLLRKVLVFHFVAATFLWAAGLCCAQQAAAPSAPPLTTSPAPGARVDPLEDGPPRRTEIALDADLSAALIAWLNRLTTMSPKEESTFWSALRAALPTGLLV